MYAATKIFASNLNAKLAQRYGSCSSTHWLDSSIWFCCLLFRMTLPTTSMSLSLPAMTRKLNYHYYHALKKSLYKPTAFFKGIMLPLCEAQCTLKEALIISSVLSHVSVPMVHSAAALKKMCELPYGSLLSLHEV